ncbi:MAG: hypothetical protein R2757_03065 [Draconibacterium sp.]
MKLRTSYGLTGNNSVDDMTIRLWALSNSYNGEAAGIPYTVPNKDLKWESSHLMLGLIWHFNNGSISL